MSLIDPSVLVGRSFLIPLLENGHYLRIKVVNSLKNNDLSLNNNPAHTESSRATKDDAVKKICDTMSY